MRSHPKAHLVGGGIGSLGAAAFLIRDGRMLTTDNYECIWIPFEALPPLT